MKLREQMVDKLVRQSVSDCNIAYKKRERERVR